MKPAAMLVPPAIALALLLNACGQAASTIAAPPTLPPATESPTKAPIPKGVTIEITSPDDSGPGSLRQALLDAQVGDTITFDPAVFGPASAVTVSLSSSLPAIWQGYITIDASNAGVILDGSTVGGEGNSGLNIQAEGVTVSGMQVVGFSGCGIEIHGKANTIGGSRQEGDGPLGQANLLSGNHDGGVCLFDGADSNVVKGNLIGVDNTGLVALGSQENGVSINGGRKNLIEGNVLSGNWGRGIDICCSVNSTENVAVDNLIGVGIDGHIPIPNGDRAVSLADGANHNTIGPGNVIANTAGSYGISVQRGLAPNNTILGNSIYNNLGSGISAWNENTNLALVPAIVTFDLAAGEVTGLTCPNCLIQVYSDQDNEGQVFEGKASADATGRFIFRKGSPLTGPHLTATATDTEGTTSMFSVPTVGARSSPLQEANPNPSSQLEILHADQLPDNRIGFFVEAQNWVDYGMVDPVVLNRMGVKRARGQMNDGDSYHVNWDTDELAIHDNFNQLITGLADSEIRMTYILLFWDKEWHRQTGQPALPTLQVPFPRFQTEEEIQRWLDFVRLMVRSFGDRVDYWELWNEPSFERSHAWIAVDDYISLARRAIPVIRTEDPAAKIVVASYIGWEVDSYREYLIRILESDIMPLVDVVAWHPFIVYLDPEECGGELYDRYPQILSEIKSTAIANGFRGEFTADELRFETWIPSTTNPCAVLDRTAGKYYAREIVHHLGEDVSASIVWNGDTQVQVVARLGTLMAGAKAASLPLEINSAGEIVTSTLSLPNGDWLIAIWNHVDIADEDTAISTSLTLPGLTAKKVIGIDVLNGFAQELVTEDDNGNMVIRNLLTRDYPILVRISP